MEAFLAITFCFTSWREKVLREMTKSRLVERSRTIQNWARNYFELLHFAEKIARTIFFSSKKARTISIFWKMADFFPFSKDDTGTFLSNSLPRPVYSALSAHGTMGKEGRGHWRLTELKWSVWMWSMTTALWGRTSLEPQQETNENAEPCLAGLYGPISEVMSNVWRPWPVKDIKIDTFTIVGFTCHGQPIPNRKGMELTTKEWCKMQVGTHKFALTSCDYERVCLLVFLLLTFCNSLDTVPMIRYKWVINICMWKTTSNDHHKK